MHAAQKFLEYLQSENANIKLVVDKSAAKIKTEDKFAGEIVIDFFKGNPITLSDESSEGELAFEDEEEAQPLPKKQIKKNNKIGSSKLHLLNFQILKDENYIICFISLNVLNFIFFSFRIVLYLKY